MPRWVKAIPSKHPRCRICHRAHAPDAWHQGHESDWTPPATEEEALERAAETQVREFGCDDDPRTAEFLGREAWRIHRATPGISPTELLLRLTAAMRARGLAARGVKEPRGS